MTPAEHDYAQLLAREQAARAEAEAALATVQRLQRMTDIALVHLELDDLLQELLKRIQQAFPADSVAIMLVEDDAQHVVYRGWRHTEARLGDGRGIGVSRGRRRDGAAHPRVRLGEHIARATPWLAAVVAPRCVADAALPTTSTTCSGRWWAASS